MNISFKTGFNLLPVLLTVSSLMMACGGGGEEASPAGRPSAVVDETPAEPVMIIIGNLTDITGPGANGISKVDMALADTVAYFNSEGLIPGVELKIITYDTQFDPASDIPGYEWLKDRGADLLFSPLPQSPVILKPHLARDEMVLFAVAATMDAFVPPGYVFCPGNALVENSIYTLLEWIPENDPDFPEGRPARIGGACWSEAYGQDMLAAAERYAKAHPDQYEWEGGFLSDFTFVWSSEVEELKDCDYVIPPVLLHNFVSQYRSAGHTAKFICTDAHIAFLKQIKEMGIFDQIDGMLIVRPSKWWTDDGSMVELAKELLRRYRAGDAEAIMDSGVAYLAVRQVYVMLELIRETVEAVGAENFDSRALYETAQSFTMITDGVPLDSLSETKRTSTDYVKIYKVDSSYADLVPVSPEWIPIVIEP